MVTFRTRVNGTQIDNFLTRIIDRGSFLNCKVLTGECVATQHKLLILDVFLQVRTKVKKTKEPRKIKCWRSKDDSVHNVKMR